MIGFSDVQELVSFFKNFFFEKRPLARNQKEVLSFKHHFEIELVFFLAITTILFRKQPIFTRESMKM